MWTTIKNFFSSIPQYLKKCLHRCDKRLAIEAALFVPIRVLLISAIGIFWFGTNTKKKFAKLIALPLSIAGLSFLESFLLFYQKNLEYKKNSIRKACEFPLLGIFKLSEISYMIGAQAFLRDIETIQFGWNIGVGITNGIGSLIFLMDSIVQNISDLAQHRNFLKLLKFIFSLLIYGGNLTLSIVNPICFALKISNPQLGFATIVIASSTISSLTLDFFTDACQAQIQRQHAIEIFAPARGRAIPTSPQLTASSLVVTSMNTFFSPTRRALLSAQDIVIDQERQRLLGEQEIPDNQEARLQI